MSATISPLEPPTTLQPASWLRKYFNIFRASLVERMAYRMDFILSTFLRFLPVMTTILLWQAVYASAQERAILTGTTSAIGSLASPLDQGPLLTASGFADGRMSGNESFKGYTLANMVAYLLLVYISRMFSSMP